MTSILSASFACYTSVMNYSQRALWTGWLLFIIGLCLPIISNDPPDPDYAPLTFADIFIPDKVIGLEVLLFFTLEILAKYADNSKILLFLLFSLPMLLALLMPLWRKFENLIWFFVSNVLFGLFFIIGLAPFFNALINNQDLSLETGWIVWMIAFGLLLFGQCAAAIKWHRNQFCSR